MYSSDWTVLYYTVLYYAVLYYTVLHCTILYCTILYCTQCTSLLPRLPLPESARISWCPTHCTLLSSFLHIVHYSALLHCTVFFQLVLVFFCEDIVLTKIYKYCTAFCSTGRLLAECTIFLFIFLILTKMQTLQSK